MTARIPAMLRNTAIVRRKGFRQPLRQGDSASGGPNTNARNKAWLFPNEGGPAILEFDLPDDLAKSMIAEVQSPMEEGKALNWGDEIAFDVGYGSEQLLAVWAQLAKRIYTPED